MHPWHDVGLGSNAPEIVNGIIEIPKASRAKYELDKTTGLLRLDRVLYSSVYYPQNYGFIPRTYCEDGDPLDILVISQMTLVPLCIASAKVIGVMRMLDGNEKDDKIIAVAENDMSVAHINDIRDLRPHFLNEIQNFFEDYKKLEKKSVLVEDIQPRNLALTIVLKAIEDYKDMLSKEFNKNSESEVK